MKILCTCILHEIRFLTSYNGGMETHINFQLHHESNLKWKEILKGGKDNSGAGKKYNNQTIHFHIHAKTKHIKLFQVHTRHKTFCEFMCGSKVIRMDGIMSRLVFVESLCKCTSLRRTNTFVSHPLNKLCSRQSSEIKTVQSKVKWINQINKQPWMFYDLIMEVSMCNFSSLITIH